jgi:CubicO group peptidase (beta-lactamase class C family)
MRAKFLACKLSMLTGVFLLLPVIAASAVTPAFAQSASPTAQIENYLDKITREQKFSGAVLVAKDDKVLLHKGYGLADDQKAIPAEPDTIFATGSLSKQFTSAAILHLEARQLLSTDTPLTRFFADVPTDKSGITVHQLLTHSSGLLHGHAKDDLTEMSRETALQTIFAQKLKATPGTKYSYSDSGYTLLAAIVEVVSGKSFPAYLKENFFEPLNLTNTGFFGDTSWAQNKKIAVTYLNGESTGSPANWKLSWALMGSGGILASVGDMYKWYQALSDNRILPAQQTAKLFTKHVEQVDDGSHYGYGWTIQDTARGKVVQHNGAGLGGNSDLTVFTEQKLLIMISTNRIIFREFADIPYDVRLYATEIAQPLAENILLNDFSKQPEPTFAIYPWLALGFAVLTGSGFLGIWWFKRRHRKNAKAM